MAKFRFDDKTIRELPPATAVQRVRVDYDEPAASGKGEFVRGFAVRTSASGKKSFLLVYVTKSGIERRHKIGEFGPQTVTTAREAARRLRALVDAGRDPYAEEDQRRDQAEAERARDAATLGGLLLAYVGHLRAANKPSAREVQAAVERNIQLPFPRLWRLPAEQVTPEAVLPALHRLTKAGKWRAAEKLTIYLRAAFNAAKAARTDAAGFLFDGFPIRSNPLLELQVSRPRSSALGASATAQERKWALTEAQLRRYWQRVQSVPHPHGAMLSFHLLTGGQRMEQLSRLHQRDWNEKAGTVTLWDSKGRRVEPRAHVLPLIPEAAAALRAMRPDEKFGPNLFTVSGGAAPAVPHTLASAMRGVSNAMQEAGEVERAVTPGAIRRTVETVLAARGIPKESRAQLLSHGIGGVQDRHYDAGDYLEQKRKALIVLRRTLDAPIGEQPKRKGRKPQ